MSNYNVKNQTNGDANFVWREDITPYEFIHEYDFTKCKINTFDDISDIFMDYVYKLFDEKHAHGRAFSYSADYIEYIKSLLKDAFLQDPKTIKMHPRTYNRIKRLYVEK